MDRQEKLYDRQSELKALLESCEVLACENKDGATGTSENWSREFDWDARANDVMLNVFGITSFRANQREVNPVSVCFATLTCS